MSNPLCNSSTAVDKLRTIAYAAWVLTAGTGAVWGQTVSMSLDTSAVAIGEPTVLRIQADRPLEAGTGTFSWPNWQDTVPGGLEILGTKPLDTLAIETLDGKPAIRIEQAYEVTAWDSGYRAIPPVQLIWNLDTLESNPLLLNVLLAAPGEPGQIAAHADIRRVQWTWQERARLWLPWALAIAALAALAFGLMRRWKNRPTTTSEAPKQEVPLEPAHIIALRELERIEREAIWKQGQTKEHHAAVSQVIRTYFERRFHYPAMERSTDEIRAGLTHLPLRASEKELILELLALTDLVKFAKWTPQQGDHIRIVEQSIRFVELTTAATENQEG